MKITKTQLKQIIKEELSREKVLVKAEVWGNSTPESFGPRYRKLVSFIIPKEKAKTMSTQDFEDAAIKIFYKKGGLGKNPQAMTLIVDGEELYY